MKFDLIVDNKVEVWKRDKVIIEAKDLEEAINLAKCRNYDYLHDSEYLSDTETYINSDDTCEIMNHSGKILWKK